MEGVRGKTVKSYLQRGIYLLCKKQLNFGRDKRLWQRESRILFSSDAQCSDRPAGGRGAQLSHLYADRTTHSCELQYPEYLQHHTQTKYLKTEVINQHLSIPERR